MMISDQSRTDLASIISECSCDDGINFDIQFSLIAYIEYTIEIHQIADNAAAIFIKRSIQYSELYADERYPLSETLGNARDAKRLGSQRSKAY